MAKRATAVEANLADFWSVVSHPLNFENPATRDTVRKIAFSAMKKCNREDALKIQAFLDEYNCG
ncbi:MAG: hypothetical protein Greene07147_246 [Parcubacteria group bacterium Greene0714_7]|nr:MAG: hypothetical protein Greene07147_246 [Parcubacteria group bacterium Greene0714_7]